MCLPARPWISALASKATPGLCAQLSLQMRSFACHIDSGQYVHSRYFNLLEARSTLVPVLVSVLPRNVATRLKSASENTGVPIA